MNIVYMRKFTREEEEKMIVFMNNGGSPISVISVCQSKNDTYTVFYWRR